MAQARAESGNVRARVNAEVAKIVDGLSREARTASARYDALSQNFERLKRQMGAVNNQSIQLEALERARDVAPHVRHLQRADRRLHPSRFSLFGGEMCPTHFSFRKMGA